MNFYEIAKKIIEERVNESIEIRLCPDQYVGKIKDFNGNFPRRIPAESRPEMTQCIIMLLESPHVEEFKDEPAPAKGATGRLIREHILNVKDLSIYGDYGLVLINAVQYQCSLGYSTDCYRDQIFISAWDLGAKDNFIQRLEKVYKEGDVVVNCCTKGKVRRQELRKLVQCSIPEEMGDVLRRTHPSSWYSPKNRNSEWEIA